MSKPSIACVNGDFTPIRHARVSILDRGFLFADAVYEVVAVIGGRLIDSRAHLARLKRSLAELRLATPVSLDRLKQLMSELVQRENLSEGLVYLQISRGADQKRDFSFPDSASVPGTLVMFVQEKSLVDDETAKTGAKAIIIPDIRWRRRDIKSTSLLPQVLGKQLAVDVGAFEAIMVEDGFITEGTSSAVGLIVDGNKIVTRPITNDVLDSVTRRAISVLASRSDLFVEERKFTPADAYAASEVFVTSATALITPVVEIDGQKIGAGVPGRWVTRLRKIYLEIASGDDPQDMAEFPTDVPR